MYKKEKTLIEELFILSNIQYLSNIVPPEKGKNIASIIDGIIIQLIKTHSSKSPQKIIKRVTRVSVESGLMQLLRKIDFGGYKVVIFINNLITNITSGGYVIPNNLIQLSNPFFEIENTTSEEELQKIKNEAEKIYNNLIKLGYFECKNS